VHQWDDAESQYAGPRLAALLLQNKLDVVGLQEVDRSLWRSAAPGAHHFSEDMPTRAHCSNIFALSSITGMSFSEVHVPAFLGNSILSRWDTRLSESATIKTRTDHRRSYVSTLITAPGSPPFRFATVHLNHETEACRLEQWGQLRAVVEAAEPDGVPLLIVGDFNALTRADYTDAQWQNIAAVRRAGDWEEPRTELTSAVAASGLVDLRAHCIRCDIGHGDAGIVAHADATEAASEGLVEAAMISSASRYIVRGPLSTCRYGTRIDYAFANAAWLTKFEVCRYEHVLTDATDHALVLLEVRPKPQAALSS
jgi:endonuclease/exonuclease/phosphatase family metal-dependent hydrolase